MRSVAGRNANNSNLARAQSCTVGGCLVNYLSLSGGGFHDIFHLRDGEWAAFGEIPASFQGDEA
jgi:hypothetical protein